MGFFYSAKMSEDSSPPPTTEPEKETTDIITDADIEEMSQKVLNLQEEAARMEQMVQEISGQGKTTALTPLEKKSTDERSVYVGNVDYTTTPEELQSLFLPCGIIERVTILSDPFTKRPKGYAYVEFRDKSAIPNALELNESLLHSRPIKVVTKRTNYPGMGMRRRRSSRRGGGGRRRRAPSYRYQPY